jgi:hypothetical protein
MISAQDTSNMLATVERYRQAGLQVIPILPDGSKRPAGKWKIYQDPDQQCELQSFVGMGVAIVCGAASGGLEVIDVDKPSLFTRWCELVEDNAPGLIQRMAIVDTPRIDINGEHGRHIYYRCDQPSGNTILAQEPGETPDRPQTTIETRGEGGYCIAPGSPPTCHPTGGTYELLAGELTDLPHITTDERRVLLECARALTMWVETADVDETDKHGQAYQHGAPGDSPGDRFAAATPWAEILEPHGWTQERPDYWKRPGKDAKGHSATTTCRSKAGRELFKVFTSNAAPFEQNKTYSKFAVYALLNHGGDFSAAAKDLAAQGFGSVKFDTVDAADEHAAEVVLPQIMSAVDMPETYPSLAPPVIHDLLRRGETCNIISVPKLRKSYSMLDLCVSVASGRPWLGIDGFPVAQGNVLLLDNELHPPTLASRFAAVIEAKGVRQAELRDRFHVDCLRGRLTDLYLMQDYFEAIEDNGYQLIVMDALYRFWPADMSENDNGAVTRIYNLIDRLAARLNCAFALVHHASKGVQTGKAVTDVGSGAGAISRAADTHIALRPHEKDDHVVMDVVTRSFPPIDTLTLEWEYPLWKRSNEKPVMKCERTGRDRKQESMDFEALDKLLAILSEAGEPLTRRGIRDETGWGDTRANRIIRLALDNEQIRKTEEQVIVRGKPYDAFERVDFESNDAAT